MRFISSCFFILGFLFLIGCGNSEPQPVPVIGSVTLNGVPMENGFIYFKTIETGTLERLDIKAGTFTGKALPGLRRVEIISNAPKKVVIDGATVEVPENIIHSSFNTESKLSAEVSTREPNSFKFDVKKK
ncbi:MAG: hypothetical protein RL179_2862 [Planctomycetota bacterium]|jgi:hypothetical protein